MPFVRKYCRSGIRPNYLKALSLGIPTWFYGNEPPNLFATHTGKYFFNSIREDGLVSVANGGIVFGPGAAGAAGTVQEIFQDTTLNYYRTKETPPPSPMVLLGVDYWNPKSAPEFQVADTAKPDPRKPVYPLLARMANQASINFFAALLLTDDAKRIVDREIPETARDRGFPLNTRRSIQGQGLSRTVASSGLVGRRGGRSTSDVGITASDRLLPWGVGDRNMRTSSFVQFGIGALIVILPFLPIRRARKPRFKPRPEPTEAEMAARRQKGWDAYLKERAGGDKTPPAAPQPRDRRPPDG